MAVLKFIFVLLILIPVALIMFMILSKLIDEIPKAEKKEGSASRRNGHSSYRSGYYSDRHNGPDKKYRN